MFTVIEGGNRQPIPSENEPNVLYDCAEWLAYRHGQTVAQAERNLAYLIEVGEIAVERGVGPYGLDRIEFLKLPEELRRAAF